MPPQRPPEYITRYLKGDSSPATRELARRWLRADAANRELFAWLLEQRERASLRVEADTEAELIRLQHQLRNYPRPVPETAVRPLLWHRRSWRVAVAASVALLLLTAYGFRESLLYRHYRTDYGQRLRVELGDGSVAELNANSALRVSRLHRWLPSRTVQLQGEAFFSVVHTLDHRPFAVQLPTSTQVDVLGTEFSVRNRRNDTKVVLKRGRVRLSYPHRDQLRRRLMQPGEWVEVNPAGTLSSGKTAQPDQLLAWRRYQFVFDHTPLEQVADQITDQFGVQVTIADKAIAERTITGVIDAQSVNELLTALQRLLPVRIERHKRAVVIYSKP